MNRSVGRARRVGAAAAAIVAVMLAVTACAYVPVPERSDVLGTWVNFDTNAMLDLAENGSCEVTALPRGVEAGLASSPDRSFSADCTWQMGTRGGDTRDARGAPVLTVEFAGGDGFVLTVLKGPKLGIRIGDADADTYFLLERALL